jgi:hypothetical protein
MISPEQQQQQQQQQQLPDNRCATIENRVPKTKDLVLDKNAFVVSW